MPEGVGIFEANALFENAFLGENLIDTLNLRNFYPIQALKSSRLIQYYANTARNSLLEIESSQNSRTKIVWLFNTYFAFQIHRKSYKNNSNSWL